MAIGDMWPQVAPLCQQKKMIWHVGDEVSQRYLDEADRKNPGDLCPIPGPQGGDLASDLLKKKTIYFHW